MGRAAKTLFGATVTPAVAKTASYTLTPRDSGKIFTNRGAAGTITFTLPKITSAAGASLAGFEADFYTVAAQVIIVASDPVDKVVADSLADASDVRLAATIGQHCKFICDGTGWLVIVNPSGASGATGGATNPRAITITA